MIAEQQRWKHANCALRSHLRSRRSARRSLRGPENHFGGALHASHERHALANLHILQVGCENTVRLDDIAESGATTAEGTFARAKSFGGLLTFHSAWSRRWAGTTSTAMYLKCVQVVHVREDELVIEICAFICAGPGVSPDRSKGRGAPASKLAQTDASVARRCRSNGCAEGSSRLVRLLLRHQRCPEPRLGRCGLACIDIF